MAAGTLGAPGTEYGPCENACNHSACGATRMMANAKCIHCGETIGYDTRFYQVGDVWTKLAHAACEEDAAVSR